MGGANGDKSASRAQCSGQSWRPGLVARQQNFLIAKPRQKFHTAPIGNLTVHVVNKYLRQFDVFRYKQAEVTPDCIGLLAGNARQLLPRFLGKPRPEAGTVA